MTGSLQIKNNKFYAVINAYDKNGKRKPKWISTGLTVRGNKKNAEKFLREKIQEYELRENLISSDILFSDYIRHWLKVSELRIDIVTLQGYSAAAKTHILPYFDNLNVKLIDINHNILQQYFDSKFKSGRIDGNGGLSAKTLRLHKNVIRQALKEAVKDNLINTNPCDKIVLPKLQRYEWHFYNNEELAKLFEAIKDESLYPLIKVTAIYGLRRSEVLGLKWDSIDFSNNLVTIKHTVSLGTSVVEKDKTKNETSYRSFPLTEDIRNIVLSLKEAEQRNRKIFGKEYISNEYIFKWDNGQPYQPTYITHQFSKLLDKYSLKHIRFHELRHSCASWLIFQGFNLKDIQEWLGHADIKLTANIYSHLDIQRKDNMAQAFQNVFHE